MRFAKFKIVNEGFICYTYRKRAIDKSKVATGTYILILVEIGIVQWHLCFFRLKYKGMIIIMDNNNELQRYYEADGAEELRLQEDSIQYTEFLTLTKYFDKVLPSPVRILDPCAGTGVYAFYLADKGHRVVAGDLFEVNVHKIIEAEKGHEKRNCLEEIYQGNVLDLSRFEDKSFDAVLCMGALYHMHDEKDRLLAIAECLRVLKKGGILISTYINRMGAAACSFDGDVNDINEILEFLQTGKEGVFYADTPTGIESMMAGFPLKQLYHIGCDGIGYLLHGVTQTISYEGLLKWRQYHFATCEDRDILGYSYHGAYFGMKLY